MYRGQRVVQVGWLAVLMVVGSGAGARENDRTAASVGTLVERAAPAVVVIDFAGRDGEIQGLGAGFIVRSDGLIATSLHVIGQGRPFRVRLYGEEHPIDPTAVVAVDRARDLALIRIDRDNLPTLELGDADRLEPGDRLIAIGHPRGLERIVVTGILSARRVIANGPVLQMAMPIEPGNSGGPVLDALGRVVGIVTARSAEGPNIGFAVPIDALRSLLDRPRPIPMERWLTIGALDAKEWTLRMGGTWRQRAGRIMASGQGSNFAGRSLCLSTLEPPDSPFEIAVDVRLEDESGAAGLVFHSDDGDKHYGFYPTGGELRLTRFAGPDVFSWHIFATVPSPAYRRGRWNTLKVRVDGTKFTGFVNDVKVIEVEDDAFRTGRVGLVKFRQPTAEFKHFRVGRQLPPSRLSGDVTRRILAEAAKLSPTAPPDREIVDALVPHGTAGLEVLRDRAHQLDTEAFRLRHLAEIVHARWVQTELRRLLDRDENDIDLIHAALLVAKFDNEDLDIDVYRKRITRMTDAIRESLADDADTDARLAALSDHFFEKQGFRGSRADYVRRSSYLNEILDDREGLPITLSVVFIELARRLKLPVVGLGLPNHFVVRYAPADGPRRMIDVFDGGATWTREQAETAAGSRLADADFRPATKRSIIVRMLRNLTAVARHEDDLLGDLRYTDLILTLIPDSGTDRAIRAELRLRTGQRDAAIRDLDWLLQHRPAGVDLDVVRRLRAQLG